MTTTTDYAAINKAKAQGRAEQRADSLRAFVFHANAVHADFEVNVHTAGELRAVLLAIGGHNHFDPIEAAELLGPQVREAMEVTIKSCTDGPYLYFTLPHFDGQRLEHLGTTNTGDKLTIEHRVAIAQRLVDLGQELKADMVRVSQSANHDDPAVHQRTGETPHTITLWWD